MNVSRIPKLEKGENGGEMFPSMWSKYKQYKATNVWVFAKALCDRGAGRVLTCYCCNVCKWKIIVV